MRRPSDYANYGARARQIAWALDLALSPLTGLPADPLKRRAWSAPHRRILLIRPDHIGDLLLASPAIRALRRALPHARIELLASPWGAPAALGNPDLDRVRTIEAAWFEPRRSEPPDPSRLIGSLLSLRFDRGEEGPYDAAADLRGDFRSVLLALASGAPCRAGFSRIGLEALLTDAVPLEPRLDWIGRNHAVAVLLGAGPLGARRPVFVVPERAEQEARRLLAPLPAGRPIAAVYPGTNRPWASWGTERFAEAARLLAARRPVAIVTDGREADGPAAEAVAAAIGGGTPVLSLAGRTGLAAAAAVIRASSVLLANDSGAAHLAVAVGTPVIAIFGPTDPALYWTWADPERNVALAGRSSCARPCFRSWCPADHGYSAITPADVAALADRLLDARFVKAEV